MKILSFKAQPAREGKVGVYVNLTFEMLSRIFCLLLSRISYFTFFTIFAGKTDIPDVKKGKKNSVGFFKKKTIVCVFSILIQNIWSLPPFFFRGASPPRPPKTTCKCAQQDSSVHIFRKRPLSRISRHTYTPTFPSLAGYPFFS